MEEKVKHEFLRAYDEYADQLFRHAYFRVYDRELAMDLMQEAFQNIWVYLSKGHEISKLRAFLYKTVRNLVITHLRKKKQMSLEELMEKGFQPSVDTMGKYRIDLEAQRIIKAIKKLPKKYQEIMTMRYMEELSFKEIATLTGHTENLVGVRINRALSKIRKILNIN